MNLGYVCVHVVSRCWYWGSIFIIFWEASPRNSKNTSIKFNDTQSARKNYLRFIQYEMDLLKLIKQQRDVGICVYIQNVS